MSNLFYALGLRPGSDRINPNTCTTRQASLSDYLKRPGVLPLLLAAVSFLLYCGTLAFKFVQYDDRKQIVDNPAIKAWSFVPQYFTGNVWALIDPHKAGNYYRPLFLVWLKINYSFFGLSAEYWHCMSVLLQALITVQVFWLAKRLLQAHEPALFAALVFAVHPVHVESVAWVSGVTDPVAAACILGATLLFLRFLEYPYAGAWQSYAGSIILTVFALLSKEIAVVLPALLIVTARATHEKLERPALWRLTTPFILLTLAYIVIRQFVLHGFMHPVERHTAWELLMTYPVLIWFYLRQLVAPLWISPFAEVYWVTRPDLWHFWFPLLACCSALAAACVTFRYSNDRRRSKAVYAWLVLPILPALYIQVFPRAELVHDRYSYLPSVGFSMLAVLAGQRLGRWVPRVTARIGTGVVLLVLGCLTLAGELRWGSELLLFKHAVTVAPHNDGALLNLGVAYLARNHTEEGIAALKAALQENPNCALAAFDIGHYFFVNRRDQEAESMLMRAVEVNPFEADWWDQLADVELALGKTRQAEQAIREAIHLKPDNAGFHLTLGAVRLANGDRTGARQEFKQELSLHPDNATAKYAINSLEAQSADASRIGN